MLGMLGKLAKLRPHSSHVLHTYLHSVISATLGNVPKTV